MLAACKNYFENLLRPINSSYRCVAFRAGALAGAPSHHLFNSLVRLGIELDVSITGGLFVNDRNLQLDYRDCEEDFLPFYPDKEDARKVSATREEIVCVPLNHFYGSRRAVTRQNISLAANRISKGAIPPGEQRIDNQKSVGQSRLAFAFDKLIKPAMKRKYFVSDTGRDRKSTRLNSSHEWISYAVFCLKKKKKTLTK